MAKATKKTKTVTELVPAKREVDDGVTLELSDKEARALLVVLGSIDGHDFMQVDSEYSDDRTRPTLRGVISSIYDELLRAGVMWSTIGERDNYVGQEMGVNRVEIK